MNDKEHELDYKITIVEVLHHVSNGKFPAWWCDEIGLCNQDWHYCVDFKFIKKKYGKDDMSSIFSLFWIYWNEYSGNIHYPIQSGNYITSELEYNDGDNYYNDTEYGNSRKRLAQFLSEKLNEV